MNYEQNATSPSDLCFFVFLDHCPSTTAALTPCASPDLSLVFVAVAAAGASSDSLLTRRNVQETQRRKTGLQAVRVIHVVVAVKIQPRMVSLSSLQKIVDHHPTEGVDLMVLRTKTSAKGTTLTTSGGLSSSETPSRSWFW